MKKPALIALILIILISATLFICLNYKGESKIYHISIKNSTLYPNEINIKRGDTVIWTNMDQEFHIIIPIENDNLVNNNISYEQTFSHTFHATGIYRYHLENEKETTGEIIVE